MKPHSLILLISFFLTKTNFCLAQKNDFEELRKYVVAIGVIDTDSMKVSSTKWIKYKKFKSIGSGLITYVKYDTVIIKTIVTAGHVLKYFHDNNIDSFHVRLSWADSIRTIDYFGISVPRFINKKVVTYFHHSDPTIDLACILIPNNFFFDKIVTQYVNEGHNPVIFPYNSMTVPETGDQVWIYGYPGHIEANFQNEFHYCITTFKNGTVTWKSKGLTNSVLDKIILVESNATFGNSGGPVFALKSKYELVGILIGGYSEISNLKSNDKDVLDSLSKKPLYTEFRSGVSIVLKGEYVKQLLSEVSEKIK